MEFLIQENIFFSFMVNLRQSGAFVNLYISRVERENLCPRYMGFFSHCAFFVYKSRSRREAKVMVKMVVVVVVVVVLQSFGE